MCYSMFLCNPSQPINLQAKFDASDQDENEKFRGSVQGLERAEVYGGPI